MKRQPYSVNTFAELEAQRAPAREAMLREHARGRIEGHRVVSDNSATY